MPRPRSVQEPERLRDLVDLWWAEADKYHVAPLDNRAFVAIMEPPPTGIPPRDRFVFRPGGGRVPEEVAPDVKGRSHRIIAEVDIPAGGAEGVLLAQGSILGGYSLFVADGRLQYVHNYLGRTEDHLAADGAAAPAHYARVRVRRRGPSRVARARLLIDGDVVAQAEIDRFTPVRFSITDAGLSCGADTGSAITARYEARSRSPGRCTESSSSSTAIRPSIPTHASTPRCERNSR